MRGEALVTERDWCSLGSCALADDGRCEVCGARLLGVFAGPPAAGGASAWPVRMLQMAGASRRRAFPSDELGKERAFLISLEEEGVRLAVRHLRRWALGS